MDEIELQMKELEAKMAGLRVAAAAARVPILPPTASVTADHLQALEARLREEIRLATTTPMVAPVPTVSPPAPTQTPDQLKIAVMLEEGKRLIGDALPEEMQLWMSQPGRLDPMKWAFFLKSDIGKATIRAVVQAAQQFFQQAGV